MDDEQAQRRRRAHYRAHHRGTLEMDLLLGRFAAAELAGMSDDDLSNFERLMDKPDPDLQRALMAPVGGEHFVISESSVLDNKDLELIETIRTFHGFGISGDRQGGSQS